MLSTEKISQIKSLILNDSTFLNSMNEALSFDGKEKGHSNASPIEDIITKILVDNLGAEKAVGSRELGDVYMSSDFELVQVSGKNFINIKFGDDVFGQPNMCSMNRIMKSFVETNLIDSYYIIKVKLEKDKFSVNVFDMFDYIDYLTWNSGTGQIMLKEADFYKGLNLPVNNLSISEKKRKIADLYIKGQDEHIALRIKQRNDKLEKLKKMGII